MSTLQTIYITVTSLEDRHHEARDAVMKYLGAPEKDFRRAVSDLAKSFAFIGSTSSEIVRVPNLKRLAPECMIRSKEYLHFPDPNTPSPSLRRLGSDRSCCLCAEVTSGSLAGRPNRLPERRVPFLMQ